ncbi:hypothetical protein [Parafilimonas sp.]|uniref:hypothetical protein n=1 Tax=Parafilimonas sp. TaxID=1969739 RepID=UPI0039E4793F
MKFATAYYLLLIYSTVILKPVIPVVEDGLQHCFAEAYHIATVHARYGNNHLEKTIAEAGRESETSKGRHTAGSEETTQFHLFVAEYNYPYFQPEQFKKFPSVPVFKLPGAFVFDQTPPPKIRLRA